MIIRKMTATFGCLDGAVLELQDGLNSMRLPNESGKSTWAAFVLAMFYGLENRRAARGQLTPKERYAPWSGRPMEGQLELELQGRTLVLQRSSENGKPFGVFRAWDKSTGIAVDSLNAENCGRQLLGVEREVFRRTAFLGGSELTVTQDSDLSRRLEQLAAAGRETDSFPAAEGRLKAWQNRLRYNRSGEIPRALERLREMERAEAEPLPETAHLPEEETLLRLLGRLEVMEQTPAEVPAALQGVSEEEMPEKARRDVGKYRFMLAACGVLCLAFLAMGARLNPLWTVGAVWTAAGALVLLLGKKLPHAYGVERVKDIFAAAMACRDGQKFLREQALVIEAVAAFAPGAETLQQARDAVTEALSLHRRGAALRQQRPKDGEKEKLTAEIKALEQREQAILLARQALGEANGILQQLYVPGLTALAGEYLQALTVGRYESLVMNETMELSVRETGGLLRPLAALSSGTKDQAWLALRLAMTELLLPEGAPIVLDDALLTFDKGREKAAMELLANRERQVLCFSCR